MANKKFLYQGKWYDKDESWWIIVTDCQTGERIIDITGWGNKPSHEELSEMIKAKS